MARTKKIKLMEPQLKKWVSNEVLTDGGLTETVPGSSGGLAASSVEEQEEFTPLSSEVLLSF